MPWFEYVFMILAIYRLTVLLTKDYIMEPVREFLRWKTITNMYGVKRKVSRKHLTYFVSCPWCCSIWVSAAIVPTTKLVGWFFWVDVALASSAITAILYERINE